MIFDLFRRQSPENPSTGLSNPAAWLHSALAGGSSTSYTGRSVSQTSALNYSAYLACVKVLSETIAVLPLKLYRRLGDGGREVAEAHPVHLLLHAQPNSVMSSFTFRECLMGHLVGWGNAYAEIERDGAGRPVALWPLLPDRTTVKLAGGAKVLETRAGSKLVRLEPGEYLHVPGLGYDGLRGYTPISQLRHALDLGMAAEEYGSRFFGRGGRVPQVLKHPGKLNDAALGRMKRQLDEQHGSLTQAQRTLILDEGMDIQTIGIPPEDSQFLQTRQFQVQELARAHRIPPHKLMDLSRATFSNIEHSAIEFVQDCALPWARRWESALAVLLTEPERQTHFAEFVLDGLLRGDAKSRAETLAIQRQWGVLSVNEWRRLENLNPIEGGDEYIVPMNMAPAGQDEQGQADERGLVAYFPGSIEQQGDRRALEQQQREQRSLRGRRRHTDAYRRILDRAAQHLVRREAGVLERLAAKHLRQQIAEPVARLLAGLERFYTEAFAEAARRELLPIIHSYADAVRGEIHEETGALADTDVQLEAWARKYVDGYITRHRNKSTGQVADVVAAHDPIDGDAGLREALERLAEDWREHRPAQIAANEAVRAGGLLAKTAYGLAGVTAVRWVSSGGCPLCAQLDGQVVALQDSFVDAGARIDPGDDTAPLDVPTSIGHPPLHKGCDCMLAAG